MQAKGLTKETIARLGVIDRGFPAFVVGDTIAVGQKIQEKDKDKDGKEKIKERLQVFEGDVIAIHNNGISSTFTIRKISHGVYVERIFPFFSPIIKEIKVVRRGQVRRAKLYYLRNLVGKKAKLREKITRSSVDNTTAQTQETE